MTDYGRPDWSASLRRGTDAELRGWLDVALAACDEADAIARSHFRRDLQIDDEARPDVRDPGRHRDRADDPRPHRSTPFPDHGLVGEEYGTEAGDASVRWYIDPIDGTHNFIRGVPLFGTLLAVERDGEMQAAVMSAPALDERWWALARRRRVGAQPRRGRRAGSTSRASTTLADAQVLYGSGRDIAASGRAPGFEALLRDAWRERGFGDFWGYALVAEGAAEAMIEVEPVDLGRRRAVARRRGGRRPGDRPRGRRGRSTAGRSLATNGAPARRGRPERLSRLGAQGDGSQPVAQARRIVAGGSGQPRPPMTPRRARGRPIGPG